MRREDGAGMDREICGGVVWDCSRSVSGKAKLELEGLGFVSCCMYVRFFHSKSYIT